MLISFADWSETEAYLAFSQLIVPRPVAWVLTGNGPPQPAEAPQSEGLPLSGAARWNLAPFSYFNGVTSAPPMLMFSVGDGMAGRLKDTHRNLRRDPHCVVHIARSTQAQAVQDTAAELPWGVSEVESAGLALAEWDWPLPRVAEAPVAMGCVAMQFTPIGDTAQTLIFLRIERVWVQDDIASFDANGRLVIDIAAYDPLARVGRGGYASLGPVVRPR